MRIVVTGGSGRIGQPIVQALLERGDEPIIVDIKATDERRCPFIFADVSDFVQVVNALRIADAVVHLAAIPGPRFTSPTEVMRINVMGTNNVLEACRQLGIRKVVIASSINAIGLSYNKDKPLLDYLPIDEAHPARPEDAYSLSKWLGEQIADAMARLEPKMSIVSLRFHGVMFSEWSERMRAHPPCDIPGNFKGLWGYVDIRDVVDSVLKGLTVEWTGHKAFFVCAADTASAVPTMDLVKASYPDVPLKRELHEYEGLFDLSKAKRLLGWQPQYSWRP